MPPQSAWVTGMPKSKRSHRTVPPTGLSGQTHGGVPRGLSRSAPHARVHRCGHLARTGAGTTQSGSATRYRSTGHSRCIWTHFARPCSSPPSTHWTAHKSTAQHRPRRRAASGCTGHPSARLTAHLRGIATVGRNALHAGVKISGAQYVYSHAQHLRRLDARRRRWPGERIARTSRPWCNTYRNDRAVATPRRAARPVAQSNAHCIEHTSRRTVKRWVKPGTTRTVALLCPACLLAESRAR